MKSRRKTTTICIEYSFIGVNFIVNVEMFATVSLEQPVNRRYLDEFCDPI